MSKETEGKLNSQEEERSVDQEETETVSPADAADPEKLGTEPTETESAEAEETEAEPAEEAGDSGQDEAEALRAELEEQENKYFRLLADFENFKRRSRKESEEQEKFRSKALLNELLPVLDNFERALSVAPKNEETEPFIKGVEMVYQSFLEAAKREGLEEVKAVGEPFDPTVHQAVMQDKDDSKESGVVLEELQKGYTLKGRVLRPSMVKVNE